MEWIAPIITAIGTIIVGYFTYNQYTRNKMTDHKLKMLETEQKNKIKENKSAAAKIYGELWRVLYELKCRRVFIIQPHPLIKSHFISVEIEIKKNGIASVIPEFTRLKMSNLACFCSDLAGRDFLYYPKLFKIKDKRARALFSTIGTNSFVVKRMTVNDGKIWVGNIVCDFPEDMKLNIDYVKKLLAEVSNDIQYILPEIQEDVE